MELTEVTKFRRAVLTGLARFTWQGTLPEHVYDILYSVVTEDSPRVRCCVHKERAVLKNRINMALGLTVGLNIVEASKIALTEPVNKALPIIGVLPEACDQCPIDKFLVTDACRHCVAHKCMNKCPKKAITIHQNRAYIDKTKCIECGMCKKVCPYGAIIEISRPCERACALNAIHAGADRKAKIDTSKCVECGSCRSACPFGAIDERSNIVQIIQAIRAGQRVHALLAPSFIGQMGFKVTPSQIVAALKKMGFAAIEEVAVGADMTALHETKEFMEKVPARQKYMTNSCCPAFVALVQKHLPNEADKVSTTISPMVACGRYVKSEHPEAVTVFIGPCIAKKGEARKFSDAIDYVLTFEELACMMAGAEIDPATLAPERYINEASGFGISFPLLKGVQGALNHTLEELEETHVQAHYASGLETCLDDMKKLAAGKLPCQYFEGMACVNGCIDGPGALAESGLVSVLIKKYASESQYKTVHGDVTAVKAVKKVDMEVR